MKGVGIECGVSNIHCRIAHDLRTRSPKRLRRSYRSAICDEYWPEGQGRNWIFNRREAICRHPGVIERR